MSAQRPLEVEYWSDVLCIWAWIAQPRVEELEKEFGRRIRVSCRFVNVFGDAHGKLTSSWADRGGTAGYRHHVEEVIAGFDRGIHPDAWNATVPCSSLNPHVIAKAVEATAGTEAQAAALLAIRRAFFEDGQDISDLDCLDAILGHAGIDPARVKQEVVSGRASAALMADYLQAESLKLRGSPSFVLDGGRQVLFGNVGYRILAANVEELLNHPAGASWC